MATLVSRAVSTVRKTFQGLYDKYLDPSTYGNEVLDVTGTYFTDHQRDNANTRLQRYKENWRFYNGEQFKKHTTDGALKLTLNMCRPIVNKSVDWLFNNGFKIQTAPGNEILIPMLETVWLENNKDTLLWEHGQMGAVTGDAFIFVSIEDRGIDGKPLPVEDQKIILRNLNSAYVFPVYDSLNPREMLSCLIQFPTVMKYDETGIAVERSNVGLYSILITRDTIAEYWNRAELTEKRRDNPLGTVPVVHTRNIPLATSFFGQSDIDDIAELNENLNAIGSEIDAIVKYHAAPTTLIFGARASMLDKGANKVWSGLPKDSRVENLKLEGELEAAMKHFDTIKLSIHELSNTPESSLGKVQQISNTSAAALEVQYMPLIEKTKRKHTTYGSTITRVNELILRILEIRFGFDFTKLSDPNNKYTTFVQFNSPLPVDRKLQMDLLSAKIDKNLESLAGALRELGEKDPERKIAEILADKRATLAEDTERAVAATGARPPLLSVSSLSSLGMAVPAMEEQFQAQDEAFTELLAQNKEEADAEADEAAEEERAASEEAAKQAAKAVSAVPTAKPITQGKPAPKGLT